MNLRSPLRDLKIRATTVAAVLMAVLVGAVALHASTAVAQSTIPANLTKLRPIKGIAYDPKPSDFFQLAYFDSDFFNSDFTAIWGDDGNAGSRRDLEVFQDAGLNFLHLYNWNAQRVNHTAFLDAANTRGIKVMVPISNFTAQTIEGVVPDCPTCPLGYQAAFNLVKGIFDQVYLGTTTPHPAAAMWGIYNEYDLNKINPVDVAFVVQALLTLEDQAGVPAANRLPITSPVSDATWDVDHRAGLSRAQAAAFERATVQWLATNHREKRRYSASGRSSRRRNRDPGAFQRLLRQPDEDHLPVEVRSECGHGVGSPRGLLEDALDRFFEPVPSRIGARGLYYQSGSVPVRLSGDDRVEHVAAAVLCRDGFRASRRWRGLPTAPATISRYPGNAGICRAGTSSGDQ